MAGVATALRSGNALKGGAAPASGNTPVKTGGTLPDPPTTLGEAGKVRWIQIGTILQGRKMWSRDWIPSLEQICKNYDDLAQLDNAINQEGVNMLVPSTNGRTLKVNPLLEYRLKVKCFIHSQLSAYGLTPMSSKGIFIQDESMQEKKGVATRNQMAELFD